MSAPALLAVAHGSHEPRAEPVLEELVAGVRARRPGLRACLAWLGHTAPDVPSAIAGLVVSGQRRIVVVPLLLGDAYHARVDLPELLARASEAHPGVTVVAAGVLGPDPVLVSLARRRVIEARGPGGGGPGGGGPGGAGPDARRPGGGGPDARRPGGGLVLGAIGSSDAAANDVTAAVASALGARVGFATCAPGVADAVAQARADGASHVTVLSWVLAPGRLPGLFFRSGADVVTPVLGSAPEVADVVLRRYDEAARQLVGLPAGEAGSAGPARPMELARRESGDVAV